VGGAGDLSAGRRVARAIAGLLPRAAAGPAADGRPKPLRPARHVSVWNTAGDAVTPDDPLRPVPRAARRRWLGRGLGMLAATCLAAPRAGRGGPPGPAEAGARLEWQPLGAGLWCLPGQPGEADEANRGQVVNLLLAVHAGRLWLLGSGPSPAFGRALAASVQARFGQRPLVLVSPAPRPEAVLGSAGLAAEAHWAHAATAAQMAARCADCVQRLRQRLGEAAGDLGPGDPVRLPGRLLQGVAGRLGPWSWREFARGEASPTTAWAHDAAGLVFAPGLVGDGGEAGLPDGRDADLRRLADALQALRRWPRPRAGGWRWLGEQGPVQGDRAPADAAAYWRALDAAVTAALERGETGEQPARILPGVPPAATARPLHALNWQRAWRQAEDRWLQRSLR